MTDELTRERIEKVKKNVCISLDSLADENGEVAKSHKDDLSTMLALANAELERQSVTDEDVAEAIEWLDEDRRNLERKVAQASSFNAGILRRELNRVRLAIQALQAYRPEREPCNWCEAQMQNVMGYVQYGCYRLDASCWNFCPVCGRKLEKAVPV